jgi:DNA invertase Pin-like site-specific DNA recombinase
VVAQHIAPASSCDIPEHWHRRVCPSHRASARDGAAETVDQVDSCAGLEAQRETLQAAAEQRRWELVDVIADEGESDGTSHEKRPGLCAALERSEAG